MENALLLTDYYKLQYESNIRMEIPMIIDKYQVDKLIYETANSVVLSAHTQKDKYAIKFIPIDNIENAQKESLIMLEKRHPHIIRYIDSLNSPTFFAIVMAIAETDLTQYTKHYRCLSENQAKKVMMDALEAVNFLHKDGIWHRDIKTDNIFVMKETANLPEIVIGDFGLACSTEYEKIEGRPVGSLNYAAPELIKLDFSQCYEVEFIEEAQYNKKVDSWCLGEVMYFILSGFHPFELGESDGERHVDGVVTFDIPEKKLIKFDGENPFDSVSDDAKDLITKLICADPDDRYSISDAMRHHWFIGLENQQNSSDNFEGENNDDENVD